MITNRELNDLNSPANIREVSKAQMLVNLNQIKTNESQCEMGAFQDPSEINRHNTFIKTSTSIQDIYSNEQIGGLQKHRYFVCSVQGKPVGIMIFIPASPASSSEPDDKIGYMLTYPSGQGYGGLLIEYAVNLSVSLNHSGRLILNAEPYSKPIYEHFGFTPTDQSFLGTTTMRLTPANSNKWISTPNGYKLKRSGSLGNYLSSFNWRCNIL
ncbi:N-acetyltransferase [Xenorhabdus beddingii]|uniref:N-acetyltransferase n=1 Tax=Xenorhabdus beddingii TaxID=40578 RepID=A0A1Y2SV79_9GAMM|nr:GNAT family N-acetyltransferase [Xenorhabdus beddingii]OTA21801.1 N-acetyltransferase [Xenorhabdus beddingii]